MIYQYQCQDCGQSFEVQATLAEKEAGLNPQCPRCRSEEAEQVFTGIGMLFSKAGSGQNFRGGGCGPLCGPGPC